jgi:hypothetical protein
MQQLEFDFDTDELLTKYEESESDFPVNELESVIVSYQSPLSNGFSIVNSEDYERWFDLIPVFFETLNKAGYNIDMEQIIEWTSRLEEDYTPLIQESTYENYNQ